MTKFINTKLEALVMNNWSKASKDNPVKIGHLVEIEDWNEAVQELFE